MNWSAIAAVLLGLAVGIGAFGAHGLKGRLDDYSMGVYEKAVLYHFFHALGLLIVSILRAGGRTLATQLATAYGTGCSSPESSCSPAASTFSHSVERKPGAPSHPSAAWHFWRRGFCSRTGSSVKAR